MPARALALARGTTVFMAVPRLRRLPPFIALEPDRLDVTPRRAVSIRGARRHGRPVDIDAMPRIELVLAGSVAVARDGARLGKGGGYSDLEFALAREAGLVTDDTAIVTTVHPLQVVPEGEIPMTGHDVPLDFIVTPEEVIATARAFQRPAGILWDQLADEKLNAIPVLQRLASGRRG